MPYYNYTCNSCEKSFELKLSMNDLELPEKEPCPFCIAESSVKIDVCAPAICDSVRIGITRPPADFSKYVLGRIRENHPKHNLERRFSIKKEI